MRENGTAARPPLTTSQVVIATLFVVLVGVALYLIVRFRFAIFILFAAIVLSTAINPIVDWLRLRGLPRPAGVILMYILIFGFLVGFAWLAVPLILEQGATIARLLPGTYAQFQKLLFTSPSLLIRRLAIFLPPHLPSLAPVSPPSNSSNNAVNQVSQLIQYVGILWQGLLTVVFVLLLGFYWNIDGEKTIRALLLLLPLNRREKARQTIASMQAKVGGFIIGQTIMCTTIGLLDLIAFLIIGLPYAFLLAVMAGLLEAVPVLGPTLGAIPAILVALTNGGTSQALFVILSTATIQLLENNLLVPRVMDRSVGVHPIVTLLSLAAFTGLFGLPGALLAVPLAAIIQVLINRLVVQPSVETSPELPGRDRLSLLQLEVQELSNDVRKQLREKEGGIVSESDLAEDDIERIANELYQILNTAQETEAA